jgi:hypothetical protein
MMFVKPLNSCSNINRFTMGSYWSEQAAGVSGGIQVHFSVYFCRWH